MRELQQSLMNIVAEATEAKTQMQRHMADRQALEAGRAEARVGQLEAALHQTQEVRGGGRRGCSRLIPTHQKGAAQRATL